MTSDLPGSYIDSSLLDPDGNKSAGHWNFFAGARLGETDDHTPYIGHQASYAECVHCGQSSHSPLLRRKSCQGQRSVQQGRGSKVLTPGIFYSPTAESTHLVQPRPPSTLDFNDNIAPKERYTHSPTPPAGSSPLNSQPLVHSPTITLAGDPLPALREQMQNASIVIPLDILQRDQQGAISSLERGPIQVQVQVNVTNNMQIIGAKSVIVKAAPDYSHTDNSRDNTYLAVGPNSSMNVRNGHCAATNP